MSIVMVVVMLGFTACSDNSDNPSVDPMHDVAIVGSWYADTTNKTFPLWNYGPAWNKMTFNADGTGHFDTFYILENRAIARDNQIAAISDNIDRAFNDLIIHYGDVNWNEQHLDHYTLSVCLYSQLYYNFDLIGAGFPYQSNIGDGYEQSAFHKLTGWGNFLRINEQIPLGNPCSQGGEPLNKN